MVYPINEMPAFEDAALKDGLARNPGVERVEITRIENKVSIFFDPSLITEEQLLAALGTPDYLVGGMPAAFRRMMARHGAALHLGASALLLAGSLAAEFTLGTQARPVQAALLGVLFALSLPAFSRCMAGLMKNRISADLLVWIIAAAAAGMGRWLEATGVIFLSVLAELLRLKAFEPTRMAGANRDALLARLVTIREGDETRQISLSEVQKDQVVVVPQGQMVPVDGLVIAGTAETRDAALTGESTYQTRIAGHSILAGVMVESGSLDIQVVRAGKDTLLASVDRLVNRALRTNAQNNRFMDRFIRGYIIVAGSLALAVFAWYGQYKFFSEETSTPELMHTALAVLLAACPLALVLSGPLTIYAGLLRAARHGVLFKGGDILEKLASIRVLLLDKTGTLTYAKPRVSSLQAFTGFTGQEVVEAAVFVERQSNHPIARAICEYAAATFPEANVPKPTKFLEFEGGGACAIKDDYYIKLGAAWLMEDGRELEQEVLDWMAGVRAQGLSFVLVANRTKILGGLVMEDALRENASSIMTGLRELGLERLIMVTGDNAQTARQVTEAVGLDEAVSECMPDTKLVRIQQERRQGFPVGMVGDGINDAPALAAADVGIAMGTQSSDLALEAADVALINNDLHDLYMAVAISKATVRFIRISAIAAVCGNLVLVGLSLAGVITLVGGVLLQVALLAGVALMSALLYVKRI